MKRIHMNFKECVMCYFSARFCCNSSIRDSGSLEYSMIFDIGILSFNIRIAVSSRSASLASSFDSSSSDIHAMYSRLHSLFSLAFSTSLYNFFVESLWVNSSFKYPKKALISSVSSFVSPYGFTNTYVVSSPSSKSVISLQRLEKV